MKTPRKTHPEAPLFYPPEVELTPEQTDQISVDFSQLTGQASNAQVPESAVVQYAPVILDDSILTGVPTAPTATPGDDSTQVATTAFVTAAVAAGGGGGSSSRGDVAVTTGSLADQATENGVIVLGKSSVVLKVTGSCACRIRLYSTSAYRTADATRQGSTDPQGEHGVMLDVILATGNLTWDLSTLATVTNDDVSPVTDIYYAIQNRSGATGTVTVTITRLPLET